MGDYGTMFSSYPLISYGSVGDYCSTDQDCSLSLVCKTDPRWGTSQCKPPIPLDMSYGCMRTRDDRRCHKYLDGQKILCDENACVNFNKFIQSPSGGEGFSAQGSAAVNKDPCEGAFVYRHDQTGTDLCARVTESNMLVPLSDQCCYNMRADSFEREFKLYSVSPQFYGQRR